MNEYKTSAVEIMGHEDVMSELETLATDLILFVIDEKVNNLYPNLIKLNKKHFVYILPSGEKNKTIFEYQKCVDYFLSQGIHRNAHLVSIGGGVTSDLAGFVASTLMRGISWSVMPTTLLSLVDASIGGKTSVNSEHGKNLIGTFYMPSKIYIDSRFLLTINPREFESGLGEIYKYAILSKDIQLMINQKASIDQIIQMCIEYKHSIIKKDFYELNERKYLNYGHTFGHAYEKSFNITHGLAVYYGIIVLNQFFKIKLDPIDLSYLGFSPPINTRTIDRDLFLKYLSSDKKRTDNNSYDFVICRTIGNPELVKVERELVNKFISESL